MATFATVNGTALQGYAPTDALYNEWYRYAVEYTRAQIEEVPGSGLILGVWVYNEIVYAFRNDTTGSRAYMYQATANGWEQVTTPFLEPDGYYRFVNYNFYGHAGRVAMFGCDGVNQGFMFDGTTFTQIATGMVNDAPTHLIAHKYHLFFAFSGGSLQHSAIGDPISWTPLTGASEIAVGHEITGLCAIPGEALAIFCRNATYLLYGASAVDWNLVTHSLQAGAVENTVQDMHTPIYIDDFGMTSLEQTQNYGDFVTNSYSQRIKPVIDLNKPNTTTAMRVKSKDQYRVFFEGGVGIIAKRQSPTSWMFTRLSLPITVRRSCSMGSDTGSDMLFFSSDDGFVYQMDKGTSFDGAEIEALIRLPFNHMKSPRTIKGFKKAVMELVAPEPVTLQFTPEFSYGNVDIPVSSTQDLLVQTGGGYWDSAIWDNFIWSAQSIGTAEAYVFGSGTNISLVIRSLGTYEQPHTLQSVLLHYTQRGILT